MEELKFYNHVQPFDSKFILDFLTNELFVGESDLKFVSWEDFDEALESDTDLKKKLSQIATDRKIDELKEMIRTANDDDNNVVERPSGEPRKVYQKFIPFDSSRYESSQNDVYHYNSHVEKPSL